MNHSPEKLENFVTKQKTLNLICLRTREHARLLLAHPACFMDNHEINLQGGRRGEGGMGRGCLLSIGCVGDQVHCSVTTVCNTVAEQIS